MPQKTRSLLILMAFSFSFSGCATIIHGSRQEMFLTCEPRVASVYVDGQFAGHTPLKTRLTRGQDHKLRIELPGYKPFETTLTRRLDGWLFGNLLLVGIAVDAASGSMYRLSPKDVYPELTPMAVGDSTAAKGLSMRIALYPDLSWEKVGQIVGKVHITHN